MTKGRFWKKVGRVIAASEARLEGLKVGVRVGGLGPNEEHIVGKIVRVEKTEEEGTRYIVKLDKPIAYQGEKRKHLSFNGVSLFKVETPKSLFMSGKPIKLVGKSHRITPKTPRLRR